MTTKGADNIGIRTRTLINAALLGAASAGLLGRVHDVGLGYAGKGAYDGGYGCDPYGGNDDYYECDYGQGFGNIGFGGGYYDNYYYPEYAIFLFDNVGRRYQMREHYRRYWGEKRRDWYRERRGGDRDGRRHDRHEGCEQHCKVLQGTKDRDLRTIKSAEYEIITTADATAREVALANGVAIMVAVPELFRY